MPNNNISLTGLTGHDGKSWPVTIDAAVWAAEFMAHIKEYPGIATDEDTMLGWFANAICAGMGFKSPPVDVDRLDPLPIA
jgi:hypothetical protein